MNKYSHDIIIETIRSLQQDNYRRDKVMLHKFLFFLEYMGRPTGLRFEPYTYGPFSFDLANNLDFMNLAGEISFDENSYAVPSNNEASAAKVGIGEYLSRFKDIVGPAPDFKDLECIGTLLYCAMVLRKTSGSSDDDGIIKEFKNWKGDKYSDDEITPYLTRLHEQGIIIH